MFVTNVPVHQGGQGATAERLSLSATRSCPKPRSVSRASSTCPCVKHIGTWRKPARLDQPVEITEATVPITLKLPPTTARRLRVQARRSGLTIGTIVTRALDAFLSAPKKKRLNRASRSERSPALRAREMNVSAAPPRAPSYQYVRAKWDAEPPNLVFMDENQ